MICYLPMDLRLIPGQTKRLEQGHLRCICMITNQIRSLKMTLDEKIQQTLEQLLSGAEIEPGVHQAGLISKSRC